MTVHELAKRLGLSYDGASCLMKSNGFPAIRIGRRWIVDEKMYERWYSTHHGVTIPTVEKKEPVRRRRRAPIFPDYKPAATYEEALERARAAAQTKGA